MKCKKYEIGVYSTHKQGLDYLPIMPFIYTLSYTGNSRNLWGRGGGGSQCVWYMWNENVKIEGEKEREKKREN